MWPALSPNGDRLAFSDYSIGGYDVAEMAVDPTRFVPAPFTASPDGQRARFKSPRNLIHPHARRCSWRDE